MEPICCSRIRRDEVKRDTTQVPAHCDFRYSAGLKADVPGKGAGKCGARILIGKAEEHTYYDVSYSFR